MFDIESVINKEVYEELGIDNYYNPHSIIILFSVYFILLFCSLLCGSYFLFISMLFIIVFVYCFMIFSMKKNIKTSINRIKENTGKTEIVSKIKFNEREILKETFSTGEVITIKYDSLKKLKKTNNYYILFTKAKQFIPISKKTLNEKQVSDLIEFLRRKSDKIKFQYFE